MSYVLWFERALAGASTPAVPGVNMLTKRAPPDQMLPPEPAPGDARADAPVETLAVRLQSSPCCALTTDGDQPPVAPVKPQR